MFDKEGLKVFSAMAVLTLLCILLIYKMPKWFDSTRTNAELHINNYFTFEHKNKVIEFHGEYYYATPTGIYFKDGGQMISANSEPLIYSDEDSVYLYFPESGEVSVYDSNFMLKDTYSVAKECRGFCVADGYAFLVIKGHLSIYDVNDFLPIDNSDFAQVAIKSGDEYLTYISISDSYAVSFDEEYTAFSLYCKDTDTAEYTYHAEYDILPFKYDNGFICSSIYNTSTLGAILYEISYEWNEGKKYINTAKEGVNSAVLCSPIYYGYSDGKCYGIGQSCHKDSVYVYTDNTLIHGESNILIVDTDTWEILTDIETDIDHERMIYADDEKVIVYSTKEGGLYITYTLSDWKMTYKQNAHEIKDGGSYTFETCGGYIFVFDDNTGELLNTISVA